MNLWGKFMNIALILSGGTGTRLGADVPKQYIKINGKMIISYCLETFINHAETDGIWIVADESWSEEIKSELVSLGLPTDKILGFSNPGQNRQLSIVNGLMDIKTYVDTAYKNSLAFTDSVSSTAPINPVVIIHDAARPNLTIDFISRCLEAIVNHDGVMPAIPMKDTVYLSSDGKTVSSLLDRSQIFAGQSPEFFYLEKYLEANLHLLPEKIKSINGSTEPAILAGLDIVIIPGDENNYKITTAADLEKFKGTVPVYQG